MNRQHGDKCLFGSALAPLGSRQCPATDARVQRGGRCYILETASRMRSRYQRWMHDWETRLTTRDTNRVVRPLDWGLEWMQHWPVVNGNFAQPHDDPEQFLRALSDKIVAHSDEFFSYTTPRDFELEHRIPPKPPGHKPKKEAEQPATFLRFTSAVTTPYAENNRMNARWFAAKDKDGKRSKRAVVVVPQWNSDAESHNALCRIFNWLGISAIRMSMPYHDVRMLAEL